MPWYRSPWVLSAGLLLALPLVLEATESPSLAVVYAIFALVAPRIVRWASGWGRFWLGAPHRRRMTAVLVLLTVVLAGATRIGRLELSFGAAKMDIGEEAETVYLAPTSTLRIAALGYPNFMSDVLFIRAHAYFLSHMHSDRIFEWLDVYYRAVKELDPYNRRVYGWATQMVKMSQRITNPVLEQSNRYAEDGIEFFPDHWRFYYDIGFNYFQEWIAPSDEDKRRMRSKALPYLALAAALPGSELDPNLVASFYEREDDAEMAMFYLYLRYWDAEPQHREQIQANLIRHGALANVQRLKRLEAKWKADKPYLSGMLYEIVGTERRQGVVPLGPDLQPGWETQEL